MGKFLSLIKTPKGIIGLSLILIVLIAIPLTVYLVQTQQQTRNFANVSTYTVSSFTQYCQANPTVCSKLNQSGQTGSVSCPSSGQSINTVYVHAGTAQTVYQLPDPAFSSVFSNNNNTVTVSIVNYPHGLSWIGVLCTASTTLPTLSPTPTPTPTQGTSVTPTSTLTPTRVPTPTDTPVPGVTITPTNTPIPGVTITPTDTPSPTPTDTPVPSATLTPEVTSDITETPTPTDTLVPSGTPTDATVATDTPTQNPSSTPGAADVQAASDIPTATVTLLPTGPNSIINIGLIGLVLLFVGGLLILAL